MDQLWRFPLSNRIRTTFFSLALWLSLIVPVTAQLPALDAERAKNLGIAYLEQVKPKDAARMFREVIALFPEEPLGYANLAASYLRLSEIDSALHQLDQALLKDPGNAQVLYLFSEAQGAASRWDQAIATLDQAILLTPDDAVLRYARFRTIQLTSNNALKPVAATDIDALAKLVPDNVAIQVKHIRFQADVGDFDALKKSYAMLGPLLDESSVPDGVTSLIRKSLEEENGQLAVRAFTVMENVLRPSERYKQALGTLQNPVIGLPIQRFRDPFYAELGRETPNEIAVSWHLRPSAVSLRASGDVGSLDFVDQDGDGIEDWVASIGGPAGATQLWVSGDGEQTSTWRSGPAASTRILDFDNDGYFDFLSIAADGIRLVRGDSTGNYEDVTTSAELAGGAVTAVAVVDFDNEGDLDLAVGGVDGFHAWQNRMDGRFQNVDERTRIEGVQSARAIVPIDHDDDDDPDLLVIDGEGRLRLFDNLRLSRFAEVDRGLGTQAYVDVSPLDFDNDGWLDLATLTESGALSLKRRTSDGYGEDVVIDRGPFDRIAVADYDNDGWSDIAVSRKGSVAAFRNGGQGEWKHRSIGRLKKTLLAIGWSDVENDGDSDLVALGNDGRVSVFENDGGNANAWLRVSLVGLQTQGTKNNLNGYGSRVEVKAGLHYQVKYADRPVTHFGLGGREKADLVRVTWSNGVPQHVFEPSVNQTLREKQVLKGSCPYLYVWDGEKYQFVTDLLGAAPLGLQLANGVIAPDNSREIVKVDADWVVEKDGAFVFQFTEELWETIYLDEVALWVVDHPEDVEAFTDERFIPPPYADLEVVTTRGRIYPEHAENTQGEDVTEQMAAYDYRFPNTLEPTRYQGIVEPHVLTMLFGDVSRLDHPTLVMRGWVFWSDTSINVAMSQGEAVRPAFPMVDVWKDGEWVMLDRPFGLPKGKDKWMVLDLAGKVDPAEARVRIRTNYQIYYDVAFVAEAVAEPATRVTRLHPKSADLHYGGFSEMYRPGPDGPHLYDYQKKVSLPIWKDMAGLATRYGDVTELLRKTDDLMVVFTAGDEVTCRFDAASLPELADGMTRSFFFLSDGWDKDADRNTVTGDTVLPLPFHGMTAYPYPEGETFPDTEAHRRFIAETLTREVGPEAYRDYLKTKQFTDRPEALPWENTEWIAKGSRRKRQNGK